MRRVVVTGIGIISSIGHDKKSVTQSLKDGCSGIVHKPEYADIGFRTGVVGDIEIDLASIIPKKALRFMGDGAAYNWIAMDEAVRDSDLNHQQVSDIRTGLIVGSGGGSTANTSLGIDILRSRGIRRVGPYMATRTMSSTNSACLATDFKIKGTSYTISSACATSAHCIGNAAELIQLGKQDIVFAGGGEEIHWTMTLLFDSMGALSSKFNHDPSRSSRPYDANRDGFVISGGGGVLVLEEYQHALKRDAKIYAELVGYGASSDGADMVQPSGEGAIRCMQLATQDVKKPIDYINTHGTSTPIGDTRELEAIREVFTEKLPPISSTKSITGHALGAAGVNEAIYSLLMQQHDFISPSMHIDNIDDNATDFPIVQRCQENAGLETIMSNSFGFGGTNASLVFSRI